MTKSRNNRAKSWIFPIFAFTRHRANTNGNVMDKLNTAYCSDKYQYTMGKSYLECGKDKEIATFNLFYRKAPENNNWAVVSGTEEVIEMVRRLGTEPEEFYDKFLPGDDYKEFRKYLSTMKFTGDLYCMREGEIVFPTQPVVTVVAPMIDVSVGCGSSGRRASGESFSVCRYRQGRTS